MKRDLNTLRNDARTACREHHAELRGFVFPEAEGDVVGLDYEVVDPTVCVIAERLATTLRGMGWNAVVTGAGYPGVHVLIPGFEHWPGGDAA